MRLSPGKTRNVEISMLSWLELPAFPHRDRYADCVLASRSNSNFCTVETPTLANAHVLAVDGDKTMQPLKTPDTDSNIHKLLVGKLINMAVKPQTNQKEGNAELMRRQKHLIMSMPERRKGKNYD